MSISDQQRETASSNLSCLPKILPKERSGHPLANSIFNSLTIDVAHTRLNVYVMKANKVR